MLRGGVVSRTGEPIAGATVRARRFDDRQDEVTVVRTDAAGAFALAAPECETLALEATVRVWIIAVWHTRARREASL